MEDTGEGLIPHRRSPQAKKFLSYKRDRRDNYGEDDQSSRRNIARDKRRQVRVPATGPARRWP